MKNKTLIELIEIIITDRKEFEVSGNGSSLRRVKAAAEILAHRLELTTTAAIAFSFVFFEASWGRMPNREGVMDFLPPDTCMVNRFECLWRLLDVGIVKSYKQIRSPVRIFYIEIETAMKVCSNKSPLETQSLFKVNEIVLLEEPLSEYYLARVYHIVVNTWLSGIYQSKFKRKMSITAPARQFYASKPENQSPILFYRSQLREAQIRFRKVTEIGLLNTVRDCSTKKNMVKRLMDGNISRAKAYRLLSKYNIVRGKKVGVLIQQYIPISSPHSIDYRDFQPFIRTTPVSPLIESYFSDNKLELILRSVSMLIETGVKPTQKAVSHNTGINLNTVKWYWKEVKLILPNDHQSLKLKKPGDSKPVKNIIDLPNEHAVSYWTADVILETIIHEYTI